MDLLDGISDKTNENNNYDNVTNNTSRADNISLQTCPENSKGRKGRKNMLVKMSSFHSGRGGGPSSAIMITAKSPIKPTLETNIMPQRLKPSQLVPFQNSPKRVKFAKIGQF